MISVGGEVVVGEKPAGGLPAGGAADQLLTGDGDWTDRAVVLEGMVNDVGAGNLRGAIDVYSTSEVDALAPAAKPAICAVTFANTGGSNVTINATTTVGGVAVKGAHVRVYVNYQPNGTSNFGLNAGDQVNNKSPNYNGGGVRSYMEAFANLSGLVQILFTGASGDTITVRAWSIDPESPVAVATHLVP